MTIPYQLENPLLQAVHRQHCSPNRAVETMLELTRNVQECANLEC